ncbi:hypothetical protein F4780DRAFT_372666 [Xylariomycetidae sp. FL0641]|nr:hypothetical protein F4780DRAFT_372666 [Xylariomycetidae sp. FL0641]
MAQPQPEGHRDFELLKTETVTEATLLGVMWSGAALSLVIVSVRLWYRLRLLRSLKVDDYLVVFALLLNLATSILWTKLRRYFFINLEHIASEADPTTLLNILSITNPAALAAYLMLWSCLWSIKLSFMAFFHSLGKQLIAQQVLWWGTMALIISSYAVCVGMLNYSCLLAKGNAYFEECTGPELQYNYAYTLTTTVLDIATDAAIIIIPVNIVWRARIPLKKKIALGCVCSLTALMIVVTIVRVAVGSTEQQVYITWLLLWNSVEMTLAIVVACVASFRGLYCHTKNTPQPSAPSTIYLQRQGRQRLFQSDAPESLISSREPSVLDGRSLRGVHDIVLEDAIITRPEDIAGAPSYVVASIV